MCVRMVRSPVRAMVSLTFFCSHVDICVEFYVEFFAEFFFRDDFFGDFFPAFCQVFTNDDRRL